jgi:hypothetical protein
MSVDVQGMNPEGTMVRQLLSPNLASAYIIFAALK